MKSVSTEPTYTVSQLGEELQLFLREAFPSVWVTGEVQRPRERGGHLYFELVEKGDADRIVGRLEAALWRSDRTRVEWVLRRAGQLLEEGVAIRCRVSVDFYPPFGRLQVAVREVDPVFTEGLLERRRQAVRTALAAAGLIERNRRLPLPEVPLAVGLVTAPDSAAFHDFVSTLRESGYGFRVVYAPAAVQGERAEREIAQALEGLATQSVDCIALVRGGGSRADLACFDSQAVAEAVARTPVPVLAGLGHETDRSITDEVAHTSVKTPTKAGELLVERVAGAAERVRQEASRLAVAAESRLRRRQLQVAAVARGMRRAEASLRLQSAALERCGLLIDGAAASALRSCRERLLRLRLRLPATARRSIDRRKELPEGLCRRVLAAGSRGMRIASQRVDGVGRLLAELAPERLLERGYSITRTADGALVRDPRELSEGQLLHTTVAAGAFRSRFAGGAGERADSGRRSQSGGT